MEEKNYLVCVKQKKNTTTEIICLFLFFLTFLSFSQKIREKDKGLKKICKGFFAWKIILFPDKYNSGGYERIRYFSSYIPQNQPFLEDGEVAVHGLQAVSVHIVPGL